MGGVLGSQDCIQDEGEVLQGFGQEAGRGVVQEFQEGDHDLAEVAQAALEFGWVAGEFGVLVAGQGLAGDAGVQARVEATQGVVLAGELLWVGYGEYLRQGRVTIGTYGSDFN